MTQFRRLFAALLLVLAVPGPAAARLANEDMADIARAEQYLNQITTLKARFIQVANNGNQAEGVAYLSRPGQLRLDYLPPNPIQVFADAGMLVYFDKELQQTSYVGINQTPAGILVQPQIRLTGGDITVTGVRRVRGTLELDLVRSRDPGAGSMTLIFGERPFALKQWRVRDPQGQVTTVSLFDTQTGIRLDPSLFQFVDPQFRNPLENRN